MNVKPYLDNLMAYVEAADYAGYDPYDALNSPLIRRIGAKSKFVRMAATQLLRRSPINFRPLLGIRKGHNAKGIGLFLWGYVKLYALTKEPRHLERIDYLLGMLERLRSPGYSGNCWGYNFDWQSRTAFRPAGMPTIVNTAFIGHALLDCHELAGRQQALDLAISIKDFILNDLRRTSVGEAFCFSYTPVDDDLIHNANLLGASILARLTHYCQDERLAEAIPASVSYSMRRQREDGSWFYGEAATQKWIDSFHTGFNLQAIRYILEAGFASEHKDAYHKGVEYYAKSFFLPDGTPKYYHDRVYPIDIHAPAQAISFFSQEGPEHADLTDRVAAWMTTNMCSDEGFFHFRKSRLLTSRIPYMRWSQAWVFHALADYSLAQEQNAHARSLEASIVPCDARPDSRSAQTSPESVPRL